MARRVHVKKNWMLDPHKTWDSELRELGIHVRQHKAAIVGPSLFVFLLVVSGSFLTAVVLTALVGAAVFLWWVRGLERHPDRGGVPIPLMVGWRFLWQRRRVRQGWATSCLTLGFHAKRGALKDRPPLLEEIHLAADGSIRATTRCGRFGVTPDMLKESAATFAHAMEVREIEVQDLRPGWAALAFRVGDALDGVVTPASMPALTAVSGDDGPPRLVYGVKTDRSAASISMLTSLLIVGVTGSGKSSVIWAFLAGCLRQRIPVRLRVADCGGGSEFAALERNLGAQGGEHGRMRVHRYTDKPAEVADVVTEMRRAMEKRIADMKARGLRKHVPSVAEPYDILVIDELLLLGKMLKEGVHSDLGALLSQGRKAGFLVWAATQMGQKEGIGPCRDLFHQRLCFATGNRHMTEAALGGVGGILPPAHQISEAERGVGFAYDSDVRGFARFRSVFIDDTAAQCIAKGQLPPGMGGTPVDESAAVYLFYGPEGSCPESNVPGRDLLYVGKSVNPTVRFGAHMQDPKVWKREIIRIEVASWHPSEDEALAEEKRLTELLKPRENYVNNPSGHRRRRAAVPA